MKSSRLARLASMLLPGLIVVACASQDGTGSQSADEQFSSKFVEIEMGGAMAPPGEGLALVLSLKNVSQNNLWVTVAFDAPEPGRRCEVTEEIEMAGRHMFTCPQRSIVADTDYPVRVRIYTDAAKTRLVESPRTKFRFGQSDVKAFDELSKQLAEKKPR